MKNVETSYSKKENKRASKIKFERFPGDSRKGISKILIEKPKKIIWSILIITIFTILLVSSSFLNKKILDENDDTLYKLVNRYDGKYANISSKNRGVLFKEIGFDVSKEEQRKLNDDVYDSTYAYHKHESLEDAYDTISVYYYDDGSVYYVTVNLVYEKSELDYKKIGKNINNLLSNFMNVKIDNEVIKNLKKQGYYYKDNAGPKISMYLNDSKTNDFGIITIIMQR